MYPHQAERLTTSLEAGRSDALVATSPENVRYVTGFESLSQAVYPGTELFGIFTPRGTALVVPSIDAPTVASEQPDVDHVVYHGEFAFAGDAGGETERRIRIWSGQATATPAEALARTLEVLGARKGRIGLDGGGLSSAAWRRAVEALAVATVVDGTRALAEARMIKGPYEIECLERALVIAEEAINAVIQMLTPGVTESEAAALFEAEVTRRGARPFCTTITMGARSAFPAVRPAEVALRPRDLVRVRSRLHLPRLPVGRRPHRGDGAADRTPGPPVRDAPERPGDSARRDRARRASRADLRDGHPSDPRSGPARLSPPSRRSRDRPRGPRGADAGPRRQHPLEAGMVLRVETPYYEPGWGGVQVKETVLVTTRGARTMNRSARGLVVLD